MPEVLRLNNKGDFLTPSCIQYGGHQWLWDAALHAIILTRFDMKLAKREMTSLLEAQWSNGFVPHTRFNPEETSIYRPNASDWGTNHPVPGTGITQPPLIATAIKEVYRQSGDKAFLSKVYPEVLKFHEWLKADREIGDSGLLAIVHPWESGTDNSPQFDALRQKLLVEHYTDVDVSFRADTKKINAAHRPGDNDYKVYWGLIQDSKKLGWNQKAIAEKSPFLVAEPLFNTMWVKANDDLAEMAEALGKDKDAAKLRQWAETARQAMQKMLWSEKDKIFYAYDFRAGAPIPVKTANGLVPLYAKIPTPRMAQAMIRRQLLNPSAFFSRSGITSTSRQEAAYEPERYWRGPVWINIQWFLIEGLRNYGFDRAADKLTRSAQKLVKNDGHFEYYHPDTGKGLGAPCFSWSALANIMPVKGISRSLARSVQQCFSRFKQHLSPDSRA